MRVASFNVENLFERAVALNLPTWGDGRRALELHASLNALLNSKVYSPADKETIVKGLTELGLDKADDGGSFAELRQNRGRLLKRVNGTIQIVAQGRDDWIGWVELKTREVNELATRHTAMVVRDVAPHILAVVEVESRPALKRFSDMLLPRVQAKPFAHAMLIDGNDDRGIDVGIMTREKYEITRMLSHVDDSDAKGQIFSRDCAEYAISTPKNGTLVVLVNHFKSKGFGSQVSSNKKRERQARRVAAIYKQLHALEPHVMVLGDLNDTPDSTPLAPLLSSTGLQDISAHPKFTGDGRPGTFKDGRKSQKIDYILLSPELQALVQGGGVFRKGVWGGTKGTLFEHYTTIKTAVNAASDHAAIFVDLDL
jgi:endonuclease/exonuclease/phosphatase family metal-dependent hydrolase